MPYTCRPGFRAVQQIWKANCLINKEFDSSTNIAIIKDSIPEKGSVGAIQTVLNLFFYVCLRREMAPEVGEVFHMLQNLSIDSDGRSLQCLIRRWLKQDFGLLEVAGENQMLGRLF